VAKFTRKELKKDPFLSVYYDDFLEFAQNNYQMIILVVAIIILVVIAVFSWKRYQQNKELAANALLGQALNTFDGYVGQASPNALAPGEQAFATAAEKYKAALKQFTVMAGKFPRQKAGEIALYHAGICQAQLGNSDAALKTLEEASGASDPDIASLARLALADELARTGKLPEARKIYLQLTSHPTVAVPAATAWLALANADRATQPAESRQIYERIAKEYSSDASLAESVNEQLSTLPH
jgi:tetratricopeptide (TPR) repeat protein